jgi:hypothetical protein
MVEGKGPSTVVRYLQKKMSSARTRFNLECAVSSSENPRLGVVTFDSV